MKIENGYLRFTGLLTTDSPIEHDRLEAINPVPAEMADYMRSVQENEWASYPKKFEDKDMVLDLWIHCDCFMKLPITYAYDMPHGYCRVFNEHTAFFLRGDIQDLFKLIKTEDVKNERNSRTYDRRNQSRPSFRR